jgi:hypothetical protein
MRLIQVTLTAGATPIVVKGVQPANSLPFQWLAIQNNAAHAVRVGDSTVSATKGIAIAAGSTTTQLPLIVNPALEYTSDLYEWFLFGTAADIIDVMLLD